MPIVEWLNCLPPLAWPAPTIVPPTWVPWLTSGSPKNQESPRALLVHPGGKLESAIGVPGPVFDGPGLARPHGPAVPALNVDTHGVQLTNRPSPVAAATVVVS